MISEEFESVPNFLPFEIWDTFKKKKKEANNWILPDF